MKVKKTLAEILKDQTITNQFDLNGVCPDVEGTSQTFNIFKTAFFLMEVNHNYYNRSCLVEEENSFTDFCNIFTEWSKTRGSLFARIMYAYSFGYNPIENYSSVETHTGYDRFENGKTMTRTYTADKVQRMYLNDKVEDSFDQYKEKTQYNNVKDTEDYSKWGINTTLNSPVPVSKNENTRSGDQENTITGKKAQTHSGGYSDTHTGSYADANSGNDTQTYNSQIAKSGNIGVLTPGEMVEKDYNAYVLHQDLQNRALKEFLDRYTFYSEGVDLW